MMATTNTSPVSQTCLRRFHLQLKHKVARESPVKASVTRFSPGLFLPLLAAAII